ncbi:MAG: lysophospholipid acyltransferase family protein [Candidatus Dormibacteria bacterium]
MRKYWAYRVAEALANMMPLAVAYALAVAVVHVMLMLSPGRFLGLSSNLMHVVGDLPPRQLRALVRANARNLGRSWIDVLRMSRPSSCARCLDIEGLDHLNAALAGGRGVVMVASHLGPWDAGLVAFNAGTGRIAVLAEVVHPRRLFDHLRRGRARLGVSVIPIDVAAMRAADADVARRIGAGALRQVFGELRGNGTVAIAMDRDLTGAGVPLQFFGEPTPIPLGVVDIAIRCNAALVPAWSLRHGGRLCLSAMPPIPYDVDAPREAEVQRVARTVLAAFEPVIKQNADQWHVLDPIWPQPAPVRTRFAALHHAPLLIALFCAALTAAGLSGWGLGLTSFTRTPDWWVRPAVGSGLAAIALVALPGVLLWARVNRIRFLAAVGRAAMTLTTAALVTGLSGVLVGALRN